MGAYMLRRRNLTLVEYNDPSYPLNAAAASLGFKYAKDRRVINPKRSHLAFVAAGDDRHADVYELLGKLYFEGGEDISQVSSLISLI